MGARLHRKIQRQMGSLYTSEVSMKCQVPYEKFILQVEGRADGVMDTEEGLVIDEIKGVFKDVNTMEEPVRCIWPRPNAMLLSMGSRTGRRRWACR